MIRDFLAGLRFQALLLRRSPGSLIDLLVAPLFAFAFLAIVAYSGRPDLVPYAVLGPTVITVWGMALKVSADIVETERGNGTLEMTLTTPAALVALLLGRISTVTITSLLSLAESIAVARGAFAATVRIDHPVLFAVTVLLTGAATAGTATAMSALFVLARSARTFQNSLSYPVYLLSGAVVPVSLLPSWLHPESMVIYLSWATGLLRSATSPAPAASVPFRLAVLAALGGLGYAAGLALMRTVLRRAHAAGTLTYS